MKLKKILLEIELINLDKNVIYKYDSGLTGFEYLKFIKKISDNEFKFKRVKKGHESQSLFLIANYNIIKKFIQMPNNFNV